MLLVRKLVHINWSDGSSNVVMQSYKTPRMPWSLARLLLGPSKKYVTLFWTNF